MKKKIFKKALAFTLAEVLITLSILGVVAAITVPSLMKRQHRKEVETKLAKTTATLLNALSQYKVANDNKDLSSLSLSIYKLSPYFNIGKNCASKDDYTANCKSDWSKYRYSHPTTPTSKRIPSQIQSFGAGILGLKDGTFIFNISKHTISGKSYYGMPVDINGLKGPNMIGQDVFTILFSVDSKTGDYIFPYSYYGTTQNNNICKNGTNDNMGEECFVWIAKNKFKIPKDYPWL